MKGHFLPTDLCVKDNVFVLVNEANGSGELFFPFFFFLGVGEFFFYWTVTMFSVCQLSGYQHEQDVQVFILCL